MGSRDFRSLQSSRKRNIDAGRETQSLPCNLNDAYRKHDRVTQCLTDMVPQITQIQGPISDEIASGRFNDKEDPRGKEYAMKTLSKLISPLQTASASRRRVDPLTVVTQHRLCPEESGNSEQTLSESLQVENETDQLESSEVNSLNAGWSLNVGNCASPGPDVIAKTPNAPKRSEKEDTRSNEKDENEKGDTCSTESEYGAAHIFHHDTVTKLQNALDKEKIPNSMNGNASDTIQGARPVEEDLNTKDTLTHPDITGGNYQERQTSNETDGSSVERPASHNDSHEAYRLPRPLSSRAPPALGEGPLEPRENVTGRTYKTGKNTDSGACHREYNSCTHPKNAKDTAKFYGDPAIGTFETCAKLGHAEEIDSDSLSSITSLASLKAPSLDSSTDTSWTSSGESGSAQNEDREQTTPKQCWSTTPHLTLQTPSTPCSNDANISHPVQETGRSDLHSNDHVASSDGSEEYDFRSDPPSRVLQHEDEFVTLHSENGRQGVADRREANIIQEQSKCLLYFFFVNHIT